jgi:hypothetical protein
MDDRHLARIRFVTERYPELQGLRDVCLGAGCAVFAWFARGQSENGVFVTLLLTAGVACWGAVLSDRYYKQRFGRVLIHDRGRAVKVGASIGIAFAVCFQMDRALAGKDLPTLFFAVIAVGNALMLARDWRFRWYLGLQVLAAGMASALGVQMPIPAWPPTDAYQWKAVMSLGVVAMIVGLLDHRMLVTTLRGVRDASELQHGHADPR